MADAKPEEKDIIVVGKRNDDSRAVWDRHPYHPSNYGEPEGEVFISDMRPYEVHRSMGIQQKLGERELQELRDKPASERRQAWEEQQEKKRELRKQILADAQEAGSGATYMGGGVVPVERQAEVPQYTTQGGLDASAHPVTAIENDPGGVGDPDGDPDGDGDDPDKPRVRRPARGANAPER